MGRRCAPGQGGPWWVGCDLTVTTLRERTSPRVRAAYREFTCVTHTWCRKMQPSVPPRTEHSAYPRPRSHRDLPVPAAPHRRGRGARGGPRGHRRARPAARRTTALRTRLQQDDARAQFARYVRRRRSCPAPLYAVALRRPRPGVGAQPANLVGAIASTLLANELHRRLTFHAGQQVSWFTAQWEGGGLAGVGLVATSLALGGVHALIGDGGTGQLCLIAAVTGAIGLVRFVALRSWVFARAPPDRARCPRRAAAPSAPRLRPWPTPRRRARLAAGASRRLLLLLPLAACSSDNVDCSGTTCTATLSGDGASAEHPRHHLAFGGRPGRPGDAGGRRRRACRAREGESVNAGPLSVTCTKVSEDTVELTASLG